MSRRLSRNLIGIGAVLCASLSAPSAREVVVEDSPGRLILEITIDHHEVQASAGGSRLSAPGYGGAGRPGAPDLPWMHFQVATGDRMPGVSVEPLEWLDVPLPGGLAGIPRGTPSAPEAHKDPALFAAARGIQPDVSEIRLHRGMRLRAISLPLATWADGGSARLLKRFRLRVDFPNPGSAPVPGLRPWLEQAFVKNPNGGRYLTSLPRPSLRRGAVVSTFAAEKPWLKIAVGDRVLDGLAEDGVYALTYAQVIAALGSGSASEFIGTDPKKLRLFAGPQDSLSIAMGGLLPATLHEIPIEVEDNNASLSFDEGDRILFYGHGTSLWKPIPGATGAVQWTFTNDPWSFQNFYYLQWDASGPDGLRLQTSAALAGGTPVTTAPHYLRAERDLSTATCDLADVLDEEVGYAWNWHFRAYCSPGGSAGGPLSGIQIRPESWTGLAGRVTDTAWIGLFHGLGQAGLTYVWAGGTTSLPLQTQPVPGSWYVKTGAFEGNLIDSIVWNTAASGLYTFDGYTVRYTRSLEWTSRRTVFPSRTGERVSYQVSSAPAGLRVLRVRNGEAVAWLPVQSAGGTAAFTDSAGVDENVVYYLHNNDPLPLTASALTVEAPGTADGVVRNLQDGSIGGARQNPEYLILAPAALLPEAVQLRNYRQGEGRIVPLSTSVVRLEDVYRDWSGGRLSPVAIRDFLRWAVNRWGAGDGTGNLKHVLLFGDGHFDYRNIKGTGVPNHVPPFNYIDPGLILNPISTDDFFGVLDSGAWWANHNLVISVGRLSLQTRGQAATYLDKIVRYESPATAGDWRSRILLAGDDDTQRGASENAGEHTRQVEDLGNVILSQDSGLRAEKVYLFDYPSNSAYLKPAATQDLLNQFNRGALFFSYFGHGAHNQLADEVLLKASDGLSRMRNVDRNFFMGIFSCTVGRFDKLADEGLSEQFVRQRDYGSIGAVSGSRETYADQNSTLGNAFMARVFDSAATSPPLVGDALRGAKAAVGNDGAENREKYILQAEPVLVLNRPELGLQLNRQPDNLQALGCDTLSGRVTRGSGRGALNVRIVSGNIIKEYLHYKKNVSVPARFNVRKRGQILFESTVPYVDSAFSVQYFLPKQLPFGDTGAQIQIFAWDSLQAREEAVLVSGVPISGQIASSSCMVDDQRGPRIAVTGCNAREAGEVDFPDRVSLALPYCLQIAVSDTGGGVLSGDGPDQGVTVEVVGSVAPFQPQAGVDDLQRKTYQVALSEQQIPEGTHLLKISARDGFGNLTQRQITLQVTQDTALRFVRAFNTPNPMKRNGTTFWFSTTLPNDPGGPLQEPLTDRLRFDLRIFNQQGYMVKEFRDAVSGATRWDGKDAWGRQLANGVYFYEVTATWTGEISNGAPPGGRRTSKKSVLVISR